MTSNNSQIAEKRRGGRPPAGTDPEKRRRILAGAGQVFARVGFDAASMSDVAREADVSKATLYVYFADKEHLFTASCAERRDRNIGELIALLDGNQPIAEALHAFGSDMVRRICTPFVLAAHRIVFGVAERMPDIGREFYETGPRRLVQALAQFIELHSAQQRLVVPDATLAAAQFLELCQATLFRPRLYGLMRDDPPPAEDIDRVVRSAVSMFLATYGGPKLDQPDRAPSPKRLQESS